MVLNIQLVDGYRIRSDRHNIILVRDEAGREEILGFYSTIPNAIESMVQMKIKGFNSTSIHSLMEALKSFQTALNKALQPLDFRDAVKEEAEK